MSFLYRVYYGDTLLDWVISLSLVLASVLIARAVYWVLGFWLKRLLRKTKTTLDDLLVELLQGPVVCGVALTGTRLSLMRLHFSEGGQRAVATGYSVLFSLCIAWLLVRVYRAIHEGYLVPIAAKSETTFDDQILPVMRSGISLVIWTLGVIVGLNNAGFNVSALLAGLGLGGLAFALAAQDTISNFFGGLTIFIQNPFKIGDLIVFDGKTGRVKAIGLRTTQLEDFDTAHSIFIPNSQFIKSTVVNVSADPGHWVSRTIRLAGDTRAEKVEQAIALIKEAIGGHPDVDSCLCRLNTFENHTIELFAYYHVRRFGDRWRVMTEAHLAMMRRFEQSDIRFALPIRVMYDDRAAKEEDAPRA
jgi:MscS family membrane protein